MVYDTFSGFDTTPSEQHDGATRSLESRRLSFQKLQEKDGDNRKRARDASPEAAKNSQSKSSDSWGPIFKNRQHFNAMHFC